MLVAPTYEFVPDNIRVLDPFTVKLLIVFAIVPEKVEPFVNVIVNAAFEFEL